jgi:hypothetical protein
MFWLNNDQVLVSEVTDDDIGLKVLYEPNREGALFEDGLDNRLLHTAQVWAGQRNITHGTGASIPILFILLCSASQSTTITTALPMFVSSIVSSSLHVEKSNPISPRYPHIIHTHSRLLAVPLMR